MTRILISILFYILLFSNCIYAQLEKVIVEKYYVSDKNDETDMTGGKLDSGSVTYRVYIDMLPGLRLKKIYGDRNHALKIESTTTFFNNADRGQIFGKDIPMNRLNDNTAALDTWLTIGQVTTTNGGKTFFGILKEDDTDGSIIGGTKNDGGSAGIAGGLLISQNPDAGIAITLADGMDTMATLPTNWNPLITSNLDSTIFDTINKNLKFINSREATLQNSGVMGVIPAKNQVLVAQLTTKGEISFEMNVEIIDSSGKSFYYVAVDSALLPNEKLSRFLKYPFLLVCGCADLNYLEYKKTRDCDNADSCQTAIAFGCMDNLACNYDPKATYNIPSLCCYPGSCSNRDIALVCPEISNNVGFTLYPNPSKDYLNLQISTAAKQNITYSIFDSFGLIVMEKNLGEFSGIVNEQITVSNLNMGLYLIRVSIGDTYESKLFMKN